MPIIWALLVIFAGAALVALVEYVHQLTVCAVSQAYAEGYEAGKQGLPVTLNRYSFESIDRQEWDRGFRDALKTY